MRARSSGVIIADGASWIGSGPALDGALALEKMDRMPAFIRKHLELDVPGLDKVFFDKDGWIAKRRLGNTPYSR